MYGWYTKRGEERSGILEMVIGDEQKWSYFRLMRLCQG